MPDTFVSPLSRDQLASLRKAEKVGFYTTPTRAYIKTTRKGVTFDIDHDIYMESVVRGTREDGNREMLAKVCYCSFRMDVDCGERGIYWRTLVAFLKPGDELRLSWGRDYETNGYMEKHELHGDRLSLLVERRGKTFGFILGTAVCENNTARMIKRGRDNNE